MELCCSTENRMTKFLVSTGALTTSFVLVDVGVQGGISPRWNALQDHLTVYGFDLLEEAIAPLDRVNDARSHYFVMGLGDRDDESDIVIPTNRYETNLSSSGRGERRRVQIRRLDTLFEQTKIEPADVIKMDCEGYEPLILRGGLNYLAASNLIGADVESNFNLSPIIPNTHFCECCEPLVRQRLMVFDIQFNRSPGGDFAVACRPWALPARDAQRAVCTAFETRAENRPKVIISARPSSRSTLRPCSKVRWYLNVMVCSTGHIMSSRVFQRS